MGKLLFEGICLKIGSGSQIPQLIPIPFRSYQSPAKNDFDHQIKGNCARDQLNSFNEKLHKNEMMRIDAEQTPDLLRDVFWLIRSWHLRPHRLPHGQSTPLT